MAAYTTLVNLPHFLSSFTSLETGTLVLFLAAVFTVQLVLLQNYSRRRRRLVQPSAGVTVRFLLPLVGFAWMALFTALRLC